MRRFCLFLILAALPALPALAQAKRDFGSPQEALWMLERVIGAMRTDQAKALQLINEGCRRLPRARPLSVLRQR